MRYYEMLFIVHPNYEQDRLDAVISSVDKEISSKEAKILKTDNWGKRKLAYLINKQRYGSYVLMYFEADPAVIQGLHEWMEIQSPVLHQIIIRLDAKPELSEESQNPDSPSTSYTRPVRASEGRSAAPVKVVTPVKKVVEEVAKEAVVEEAIVEEAIVEEAVVEEAVVEEAVVEEAVVEAVVESPSAETSEDKEVVEEVVEEETTKEEGE